MPDAQPLANNADMAEDSDKTPLSSMSPPIPYIAPFHLQATAHLYGIKSAIPEKARVLEVGCKDGGNLLPFALANPQAQAVGVDLDAEQIEKGNALIKQLELENIALFALDLESLLACDPGTFDYIIIHGLFSLIGGETRDALLRFCRDHLTAEGIVCYSYNTYPGWKTGEILRDAIQLHSSLANDDKTAQASARAMLTYLSLGTSPDNPQNAALKAFIEQAEKQSDVDFALHYLQGLNQPCYFVDFYAQISQVGFSYVGDVRAYTELAGHYGDQVSHLHETICPENTTYLRQQYLDFAVNRSQRFSILVPQERAGSVLPEPDLSKLADFNWAGNFQRVTASNGGTLNVHTSGTGETIGTENRVVLSVLDALGEAWPASLSLDQLIFNTRLPEKETENHRQDILDALKNLFVKGIGGLYARIGNCTYRNSPHKTLTGLTGLAETDLAFNFWHEPVSLDSDERRFLQQLSSPLQNKDNTFYSKLWALRNKGVVWGTLRAWRDYLQEAIIKANTAQVAVYIQSLVVYISEPRAGGPVETEKSSVNKKNKPHNRGPLNRKVYEDIERLTALGHFAEVREKAEEIISTYPDNLDAWYPFVRTHVLTGDFDGALSIITRAIALVPFNWDFYIDLAVCLWKKNELHHGMALTRKVLRCDKQKGLAWDTLAVLLNITHDLDSAFKCMEKALQIEPENPNFISHMGMVCHNLGRKDAVLYHRKTIELMPHAFHLYSNLLLGLSHDISITPQALFQEHLIFGQRVEAAAVRHNCHFAYSLNKDIHRPLRIGFISGDFGNHPVTNFLEPIWNSLDRREFSLYAYSSFQRFEEKAESLKQTAAGWYDIDKMGDLEVATLINKDEIDILIDLSGHTAYNRLPVFALKPAPIQITWLGYPGTTGMRSMDYILMDRNFLERGALDDQLTESAIYMPSVKFFEPHNDCPDVNELPALKNGYLTFASFNRPQKITDETLALWAKVLTALPDSHLVMGYMTGQECIDYFRSKLIDFGVLESQLSFRMRTGLKEYLGMHQEVDMLLDAYPYSGGTTVGHAAWMGVPVLTLEGVTMASRQGGVIMRIYGLSDFVAGNNDEFISKALYWSKSFKELSEIRIGLRERMSNKNKVGVSPSFYFEKALHQVWKNYCEGNQPRSFRIESDGVIL
ncbi:methyltransferase regulatory domain-containing protein [Dickeya chrysanthemi]|uniref:protein O-GlcNAc transferase n=2 Tax=Dickeya chrysanthemi TaxID=556 RepID=A0ABU8JJD2_DICCH|nr:methyltransferase regulatory domain-containing protein [Dickeya chrysanthemi]MCA7006506.1 methyltransferase regulatory domain-containing protein [Dickeya chrysanthemi]